MSKSIKLNAFYKSILSVLNILFPLVTAPYIARVLSVDGFTEYNRAVSMVAWFSPFAVFGVYTYGLREVAKIRNDRNAIEQLFTKLFSLSLFFCATVTIVYLVVALFVSSLEYRNLYVIASGQLISVCFATDYMNEAGEKYGFILLKSFFCRLLYVVAVFLFVRNSNDAWIYMLLSSASVVLNNLLTFFYNKYNYSFRKIDFKETLQLIKPLFVVFLLVNSSMLYTILDRFALIYFGDKIQLTYYHIAQVLSNSVVQISSSIVLVTIPRLSFFWGNNKKEEYYNLLGKSSSLFSVISIPCCIGMACLADDVMYLYAGEKYLGGTFSLFLFCFRYFISNFDTILSKQVLLATGNEKCLTKIYYTGGVYNILLKLVLVLVGRLNAATCIITTTTADILVIVLQTVQIHKKNIMNKVFNRNLIVPFISSLLFILIIKAVKCLVPDFTIVFSIIRCTLCIVLCAAFYFFALMFSKNEVLLNFFHGAKK